MRNVLDSEYETINIFNEETQNFNYLVHMLQIQIQISDSNRSDAHVFTVIDARKKVSSFHFH